MFVMYVIYIFLFIREKKLKIFIYNLKSDITDSTDITLIFAVKTTAIMERE